MIQKREGVEFRMAIPTADGACVSMIEYKGQILLACQFAVYQLSNDKVFKKIRFEEVKP